MKKIITGLMVLSLIVVGGAGVSLAYGGPEGKGMSRMNDQRPYYENRQYQNNPFDLSEEELNEFTEIKEEFFEEREELVNNLRENNRQLRELILSGADDEEIANLRNKINVLQNDVMNMRTEQFTGLKEILSDEQIEELIDIDRNFAQMRNNSGRKGAGRNGSNRGKGNRF